MTKEARSKSFPKCDLIVYVTVKDINNVSSSGTGDVKFQGSVKSQILRLSVSGTGDVSVPVFNGDRLKVSISGTGDVLIGGNVNNATFSVSGTGDINAKLSEPHPSERFRFRHRRHRTERQNIICHVFRFRHRRNLRPQDDCKKCRGYRFGNRRHNMLCFGFIHRKAFRDCRHNMLWQTKKQKSENKGVFFP